MLPNGYVQKLFVGSNNNDIRDFCRVPLMYMYDIRGRVTFVHETSSRAEYRSIE